jgi:hypothetical protein
MAATGTAIEYQGARPETNGSNGVWKWIATFLAGVVLSQGVAWATYVRGAVTRADVDQMIQDKQAPIGVELQNIKASLSNQAHDLREAQNQLTEIAIAVGAKRVHRAVEQ